MPHADTVWPPAPLNQEVPTITPPVPWYKKWWMQIIYTMLLLEIITLGGTHFWLGHIPLPGTVKSLTSTWSVPSPPVLDQLFLTLKAVVCGYFVIRVTSKPSRR